MNTETFINSLINFEKTRNFSSFKNYSLEKFSEVLKTVLPNEKVPLRISIVGTNGKGSTSYYLSKLALANGFARKIGLYTSPHLITKWERIQVNHEMISEEWTQTFLESQHDSNLNLLKQLSFFEFFTLLSLQYFQSKETDLDIYEAGLGGRLDATKLVNADTIVLTKIGFDHTEILGETLEEILLEKLNIATKHTKRFFSFEKDSKLHEIIEEFCNTKKIQLFFFEPVQKLNYLEFNKLYAEFILEKLFQQKISKELKIPDPIGRMQVLKANPIWIYDIAHNPQAVETFLQSIEQTYPEEKNWTLVFACLKDKDAKSILEILVQSPIVAKLYRIINEEWNAEIFTHEKIETINTLDYNLLRDKKLLILGSSRLYERILEFV